MRSVWLLCALLLGWGCKSTPTDLPAPPPEEVKPSAPIAREATPAEERDESALPATEHLIRPGDTLWAIGLRYGCSIEELRDKNDLTGNTIHPGRRLLIPACDPAGPTQGPKPTPAAGRSYTIRAGDFLERIAAHSGCSVPELMAANELTHDVIYAGETLLIPDCAGLPLEDSAAADDETPPNATAPPVEPEKSLAAAADGETTHIVRPGEYLGLIASRAGCNVGEISRANDLQDDMIRAGQRLIIPVCEGEGRLWDGLDSLRQERRAGELRKSARAKAPPRGRVVRDNTTLEELMRARGFRPPPHFKALVVEIRFNRNRTAVAQEHWFSWRETGYEPRGWNPASTIKLYAAIAAYRKARRLGYSGDARITFHGNRREHTFVLNDLVRDAIGPSSNIAYNYLVSFVGFDRIHNDFFHSRFGFRHAGLRRPYERENWMNLGWSSSLAASPRITLRERNRTHEIPPRTGRAQTSCHSAACTSLAELAGTMRRVMLQEQLPAGEAFGLHPTDLRFLRRALASERNRGQGVVNGLGRHLKGPRVNFFHKAGFSQQWFSDNVYVYNPRLNRAWIITMAGKPGRDSLDEAARVIGQLIAGGALGKARSL